MMLKPVMHQIRDTVVALARHRPFDPIENPEKRIVLVRPDHFGDMLMLAPALEQIRGRVHDHELVLMTGPWNREVAGHITNVDRIITWEFPGFTRDASTGSWVDPYRAIGEAATRLRELRPAAIILLRDDHWWGAVMAREAGVPLRFGYAHRQVKSFLSHPMEIEPAHYVEQNQRLIQRSLAAMGLDVEGHSGALSLNWPVHAAAAAEAKEIRARAGIRELYVVIHPGTGAPVKRWPVERWTEVIDRFVAGNDMSVILTGSPEERPLCAAIEMSARAKVTNLAGQTSLFSLAEILRDASLVMGVDSGPLHLATAVGSRSLHVYGPSDHVRYGPWGDPAIHCVVHAGMRCPSCGDLSPTRPEGCGCMMAISVDQVLNAADRVLGHAS